MLRTITASLLIALALLGQPGQRQKPPVSARMAKNSLTKDLKALWTFSGGAGGIRSIAGGSALRSTSAAGAWVPTMAGPGIDTNGARITVADAPELNPTDRLSVWMIVVPTGATAAQRLFSKGTGSYLELRRSSGAAFELSIGGGTLATGNNTFPANTTKPLHVCMTWDKDKGNPEIALYINGRLHTTGTRSTALTTNANILAIGGRSDITGNTFVGPVVAAGLWHRALSAAEVQQLYNDPWGSLIEPDSRAWMFASPSGGGAAPFPAGILNNPIVIGEE